MPFYKVKAFNPKDNILKEEFFYNSLKENLCFQLKPFNLVSAKRCYIRKKLTFFELYLLCSHLESLLKVPILIQDALKILCEQNYHAPLRLLCFQVLVSLKKGKTLHEAFVELPFKIHPFMMVYLFAFEHYGNLQQGFSDLSCYFFEKDQQKKNAQKSYRYPFFLFFIFVNLIFLFHYQIIPVFEDILLSVSARQNSHSFERFKQLTYYFLIFFGGTSILVVVLFCLRFFSSHFREKMDSFLFKAEHRINIQSIKNFLFIFNQKEILNILIPLAHLLKQQVHLTKSLSLLTECTSNLYLKSVIFNILKDVKQGQSFFQSLERTKHFPNFLLSAVLIGENSDDFPELFYKATLFFKDDLDIRTRRFFEFLGPFLIFIAGMFIVLIIMSTILPFYEHMVQIAVSS